MIKINLANNLIKKTEVNAFSSVNINSQMQDIVKVVVMVLPLVGLYFYERHDLEIKQQILDKTRAEDAQLAQELSQVSAIENTIKQTEEQKRELEEKLSVMRKIFGLRHQKLQSIRILQNEIAQTSWLTKISFKGKEAEVTGYAPSLQEAQDYIGRIVKYKKIYESVTSRNIIKDEAAHGELYKFDLFLVLRE